MEPISLLWIYAAFLIVMVLHEYGHIPTKGVKLKKLWIFPYTAAAMSAKWREGGLFVNIVLFSSIAYFKPEFILLQLVGLIAFVHFIVYTILGSIIPEPKDSQVDLKTYVFDDVNNKYALVAFGLVAIALFLFYSYYLQIFRSVFQI